VADPRVLRYLRADRTADGSGGGEIGRRSHCSAGTGAGAFAQVGTSVPSPGGFYGLEESVQETYGINCCSGTRPVKGRPRTLRRPDQLERIDFYGAGDFQVLNEGIGFYMVLCGTGCVIVVGNSLVGIPLVFMSSISPSVSLYLGRTRTTRPPGLSRYFLSTLKCILFFPLSKRFSRSLMYQCTISLVFAGEPWRIPPNSVWHGWKIVFLVHICGNLTPRFKSDSGIVRIVYKSPQKILLNSLVPGLSKMYRGRLCKTKNYTRPARNVKQSSRASPSPSWL
jgi:hypothetical protein